MACSSLERNRGKHLLILFFFLLLLLLVIIIIFFFLRTAALEVWSWFPLSFSNLSFFQCGLVRLISNPQSWGPSHNFGLCSPRELVKCLRSPPYTPPCGTHFAWLLCCDLSGVGDPSCCLPYRQHSRQLHWSTQSSHTGLICSSEKMMLPGEV